MKISYQVKLSWGHNPIIYSRIPLPMATIGFNNVNCSNMVHECVGGGTIEVANAFVCKRSAPTCLPTRNIGFVDHVPNVTDTPKVLCVDDELVLNTRFVVKNLKMMGWKEIWVNQPIHSFLVGCLNPCLQGTNVPVGSPQLRWTSWIWEITSWSSRLHEN